MNTIELKDAARLFGADLIGVAPVAAFADLPPEHNPLAIFPQAKSLIVVGRRIPRGTLVAMEHGQKLDDSFKHFGFSSLEDNYLAKTTYDVGIWIEARGFEAVPMFGYDIEATDKQPLGASVDGKKPAPNVYVDWKLAAQAAGLGKIGVNGLFLTPEFGTRQRFAMLLSDYEFENDPECEVDFCTGCRACIDGCPLGALQKNSRDNALCNQCRNGAIQTGFGRFDTVERIGAACGRSCLASLETRGILKQKFRQNLRNSTPWQFDFYGKSIDKGE